MSCGEQHRFKFITDDATDLSGHQAGVAANAVPVVVQIAVPVVECAVAESAVTAAPWAAHSLQMDVVVAVGVAQAALARAILTVAMEARVAVATMARRAVRFLVQRRLRWG